ncbi:MAG: GAF domain-containing sensor histidine kinase [Acidimicrobiia bacterium]|jgi:signal transduction histidine kinase
MQREVNGAESRAIVADAVTGLLAPVAFVIGLILLVLSVFAEGSATLRLGVVAVLVGVAGWFEGRGLLPSPASVLGVAVVGIAYSIPTVGTAGAVALVSACTLLAAVGVLALRGIFGAAYGLFCLLAIGQIVRSNAQPLSGADIFVTALVLAGVGGVGWRLLTVFRDTLTNNADNYRLIYDLSPVALLVEDFTKVRDWLDSLRASGVRDVRRYLEQHPDELRHGASLIDIVSANAEAVHMIGADSEESLKRLFKEAHRQDHELQAFREQFVAIWHDRRSLALDLAGMTLHDEPMAAVLHWSIPVSNGRADLSQVRVAISDVTPRKVIEQRLAMAVESNERLLTFEHALAACSRALLLGVGEDALEVALEEMRQAIGADRSFLAVNVDDEDLGPCFKVINSASSPEHAHDDWIGLSVPWGKYPAAHEPLSNGEPFQHVATETDEGWNRSLLVVPVFASGTWTGTVGFVDIDRKTHWNDDAIRMLEVASPMLGTFWERELTRRRLEELVESKDRFVATISHELRTPLSAVLGFAEELKSQASSFEPHETTEILELIAEQSRDMADMVEDLLVAARAEIGTVSVRPEVVYLRSQAEAALVMLGSPGAHTIDVVGGPGKAWVDPARTRQIIRNLITNAVRYGGSDVVIEASTADGVTTLSVRDSGTPLDPSQWERIFEPYERAHDRATTTGSVGLGLSVSRQLARLMGGDLVYRGDETGSVFELTVPAEPSDRDEAMTEISEGVASPLAP